MATKSFPFNEEFASIYLEEKIGNLEVLLSNDEFAASEERAVCEATLDKLKRLRELKVKLEVHEQDIKMKYLIAMRERNVYLEKLKMIEGFCFNAVSYTHLTLPTIYSV
eukprot:TRINITY_DN7141_c0_g1_i4.p1 TRINITY_DN7141_c0_g1~~TRINITY_DN7141_c0_g1_i4.p1  ORF type:complete len:109 (+),score=31.86 TRINITY_DN7141_c0_g1_i4:160-486(+)